MIPDWMNALSREQDNKRFSQLCHDYYKLATMRVMQRIREEYQVPKEDIASLTLSIFARFLNESCYAIGGAIKNGQPLDDILGKEQQLTLLKIFMNEPLEAMDRIDIEVEMPKCLNKFKEFIINNAGNFYLNEDK